MNMAHMFSEDDEGDHLVLRKKPTFSSSLEKNLLAKMSDSNTTNLWHKGDFRYFLSNTFQTRLAYSSIFV